MMVVEGGEGRGVALTPLTPLVPGLSSRPRGAQRTAGGAAGAAELSSAEPGRIDTRCTDAATWLLQPPRTPLLCESVAV